jgi:hypothetical protein
MAVDPKIGVNELRELVKNNRGIKVSELAEIATAAEAQGGSLVAVTAADSDGDWCGNGRFRFKWPPPKPGTLGSLIDLIINKGIGGHIIINGIPHPEEVLIDLSRGPVGR